MAFLTFGDQEGKILLNFIKYKVQLKILRLSEDTVQWYFSSNYFTVSINP